MQFPATEFYTEDLSPDSFRSLRVKQRIVSTSSAFQEIEVLDTYQYGRTLVLDRCLQATERDTFIYHETLVHPPALMLERVERALVIGGGDGGILRELLKHESVSRVVVAEIDPAVIEVSRTHLPSICGDAFDDPRAEVLTVDGREYLETENETFDLVIFDLTDPVGPSRTLYTREAYHAAQRRLTPAGVLATHAGAWFNYPKITSVVVQTIASVFPHHVVFPGYIDSYGMELAFVYAAQTLDFASVDPHVFAERWQALNGRAACRYVDGQFVTRIGTRSPMFQRVLASSERVSTDEHPLDMTDYYQWIRQDPPAPAERSRRP